MNIKFQLRLAWLGFSRRFRPIVTANICGHSTNTQGKFEAFGKTYAMIMPLAENGRPDYCIDCIGKMSIQCAWCGGSILIGEPITLYIPKDPSKMPAYAVAYDADPTCFVGCLRWECGITGADRAGFWMPPGRVERVPSPIEMLMSSSKGSAVIVGDLSDPNDLGKIIKL
jgi:hypothetical protein